MKLKNYRVRVKVNEFQKMIIGCLVKNCKTAKEAMTKAQKHYDDKGLNFTVQTARIASPDEVADIERRFPDSIINYQEKV